MMNCPETRGRMQVFHLRFSGTLLHRPFGCPMLFVFQHQVVIRKWCNHALQRLEQFGKLRKEFGEGKGIAGCDTETAGAVESTAPRPSSTLRSSPATEDGSSWSQSMRLLAAVAEL